MITHTHTHTHAYTSASGGLLKKMAPVLHIFLGVFSLWEASRAAARVSATQDAAGDPHHPGQRRPRPGLRRRPRGEMAHGPRPRRGGGDSAARLLRARGECGTWTAENVGEP